MNTLCPVAKQVYTYTFNALPLQLGNQLGPVTLAYETWGTLNAADSVAALLQHDMGTWRVFFRRGLAACDCIGSGFTADQMSLARAVSALAGERIPVIAQGASGTDIILIVEEPASERALRCQHRDLIAPAIPLVHHEMLETHEKWCELWPAAFATLKSSISRSVEIHPTFKVVQSR